jgi:hypothetical protein
MVAKLTLTVLGYEAWRYHRRVSMSPVDDETSVINNCQTNITTSMLYDPMLQTVFQSFKYYFTL